MGWTLKALPGPWKNSAGNNIRPRPHGKFFRASAVALLTLALFLPTAPSLFCRREWGGFSCLYTLLSQEKFGLEKAKMDSIRHNSSLFFGSKQNLYGNVVSAWKDGVKYKTEELSPNLDSDGFCE